MYKKLIITSLTLLFCAITFAQEQQDRWIWPDNNLDNVLFLNVGIGPKIGGGLATATAPLSYDFALKSSFAYQIGAAFNVYIGHHSSLGLSGIEGRWGVEIEALYSSLNFNAGIKTMTVNCLEVPILLQFYVTPELQVEAGATPTKLLKVSPEHLQTGHVVANAGNMQGGDVKLSIGACYKTAFGLSIGLRYNLGMSELAESFHSKTSTAMLSINYLFPLIKEEPIN